jgi:hypothetical protein
VADDVGQRRSGQNARRIRADHRRFICGDLSASDFESEFLSYFKNDKTQVVSEEFEVLDGLFADVDLDAVELRLRARQAYVRLYDNL